MSIISRRDALRGVSGALGGASVLLTEKDATASPVQDPLVGLWQRRAKLLSMADRLADEGAAIEETLPEWARNFEGITIQVSGCEPRTCRTTKQIDAAIRRRSLFSLDPPSKEMVSAWRAEGKAQRDAWVMDLAGIRQRFERERERSGYTAKIDEYDAMMDRALDTEVQIVDTQAVTVEGLLVQALLFAELKKDEEPQYFDYRLAKSMGIAARRMAPGLAAQTEHLSGGLPS